jgi:hypothetical protein
MDAIGSEPVTAKDGLEEDLQAALAEIEKVSGAGPGAEGTPGGAREEPDTPELQGPEPTTAPGPEPAEGEPAETPDAPQAESAVASAAAAADAEQPSRTAPASETVVEVAGGSVSDEEIAGPCDAESPGSMERRGTEPGDAAAPDDAGSGEGPEASHTEEAQLADDELTALLAEVEESAAQPQPSAAQHGHDNDTAGAGAPHVAAGVEPDAPSDADRESTGQVESSEPDAEEKKLRFEIGKKSAKERAAASAEPAKPAKADRLDRLHKQKEAVRAIQPVTPWGKRLFRLADQGLDTINRPFERVGDRARNLVGYAALTTVIVSLLAMILMPLIMPHRDAIMFLQEKRAALEVAPAPDETAEGDVPASRPD